MGVAMSLLDVNFDWPVCDAGYKLTKPKPVPRTEGRGLQFGLLKFPSATRALGLEPSPEYEASPRIVPKGKGERLHRPLEFHKTLYADFAKLDGSGDSCVEFANRFGLLWQAFKGGEPLIMWRNAIAQMAKVIELSQSDSTALAGYRMAPLHGTLVPSPPDGKLTLRFGPHSLLHGMQLQFAQAVSSGLAIKECRQCGKWFEAGGDERRRDAQFCSKDHKIAFHNLEKRRVTR